MADRVGKVRNRNLWPADVPLEELGAFVREGVPEAMLGAHAHLEVELNYVRSGWMGYRMAGGEVRLEPGVLAAFWAALPHQLSEVGEGTRCVWVTLPLAAVLQAGLAVEVIDRLLAGEVVTTQLPDAVPGRWSADGDARSLRAMRLEIQAALLRMRPGTARASAGEPGAVETMCRFVAASYREPLTVMDVARAAGLHPNYAMRLFRSATGLTINDTILRHRLGHAQRLLLDSDLSVEVIAADSGFGSASRFYEVFQARTGQTPRGYRRGSGWVLDRD